MMITPSNTRDRERRQRDSLTAGLAERYLDRLVEGDQGGAGDVIAAALGADVDPERIQVDVIGRSMERIGDLWESGDLSVADEHLATAICQQMLVRVIEPLQVAPANSRESVLLAAVEGQHHALGLRMIADVLDGAGYVVRFLGPDVPVEDLAKIAGKLQPDVTGLSCTIRNDDGMLYASIRAVREAAPMTRLMLGGCGSPPDLVKLGIPVVDDSLEVLVSVDRLLDCPPQDVSQLDKALARRNAPEDRRDLLFRTDESMTSPEAILSDLVAGSSDVSREYARRAGEYRELSLRDPLTGLPNRRDFDGHFETHVEKRPNVGALLLIDVDKFKEVNDTRGHEAGDETLCSVAAAIEESIRPKDFGARIGGDEFAALLPKSTLEDAVVVGERICEAVRVKTGQKLTLSIGAAAIGDDVRDTFASADEALYRAKDRGRDRVATASAKASTEQDRHTREQAGACVSFLSFDVELAETAALVRAVRDRSTSALNQECLRSTDPSGGVVLVTHWRSREDCDSADLSTAAAEFGSVEDELFEPALGGTH